MNNELTTKQTFFAPVVRYFKDFGVLKDNPREFWAIQAVNFLEALAYFSMMTILTIFLSDNIDFSDIHAGYIVTMISITVSILLPFTGFLIDSLGIKKSIFIAVSILVISRIMVLACGLLPEIPGREWLIIISFFCMAFGMALLQPTFQAANRRFSSERSRGASFSIWYLIMNLGGVAGALLVDYIRLSLAIDTSYVFAFGGLASVIALFSTLLFIKRLNQVTNNETAEISDEDKEIKQGFLLRFQAMVKETAFKRLLVLIVLLLGVRANIMYIILLFPKYWIRVIGPDVELGFLQSINFSIVVIGLLLFIPLANRLNVFTMLIVGTFISSFSLLILVLPFELFGADVAQGYFRMAIAMMIVFSIGEVIWSPKLQEYIAAIAPKGQEGSYLGMSMIPWFAAKLIVGIVSGHMLMRWSPEGVGEQIRAGTLTFWQAPEAMFFILFLFAVIGPIVAFIYRDWFMQGIKD